MGPGGAWFYHPFLNFNSLLVTKLPPPLFTCHRTHSSPPTATARPETLINTPANALTVHTVAGATSVAAAASKTTTLIVPVQLSSDSTEVCYTVLHNW